MTCVRARAPRSKERLPSHDDRERTAVVAKQAAARGRAARQASARKLITSDLSGDAPAAAPPVVPEVSDDVSDPRSGRI